MKGDVRAWDSSEATRVNCALPREPGRERMWGTLGFSGDETNPLLNEREGGVFEGESGVRRGESALEVVGVRGCWSSGLLEPLLERSSPVSAVLGHGVDMVYDNHDDE